jgi:arylsulfatase A-like enzyme
LGRFVATAVTVDVLLACVSGLALCALFALVRAVWPGTRAWRWWPALMRAWLIAGAAMYLFVCQVRLSALLTTEQGSIVNIVLLGAGVILSVSAGLAWGIGAMERRFGRWVPRLAWALAAAVTLGVTTFNHAAYRSAHTFNHKYPALGSAHRPNIMLVTFDTVRWDYLGCYGNSVVKTPTVDALAADGVRFESAIAQAASTAPSHCSIMTSTYAAHHGAVNGVAMRGDLPTLAEILGDNGYDTAAFVSSTTVRSTESGLHRGFNLYDDSMVPWSSFFKNDECQFLIAFYIVGWWQHYQLPGHVVSDRTLRWLGQRTDSPFFAWVHYFDPHAPYDAPEPYKTMYAGKMDSAKPRSKQRALHAGEVTFADAQLGRVIEALKAKGLYDDMLIIFASDHGEGFGEVHSGYEDVGHGWHMYDTTQRVPLIVKLPGNRGAGRRVEDLVQLVDLAPTVLDLLSAEHPESYRGRSLMDLLDGAGREEPGVAFAECPAMPTGPDQSRDAAEQRVMSMRTPQVKFICNGLGEERELYDLIQDPEETTNVYLDNFDLADACYQSLVETLGEPTSARTTVIDPKVIEQLKALGYIDDGEPVKDPPTP